SDVASVIHHNGSGYLMVTIIRKVFQLYLAENPEKISSHNCSQEMSERWAIFQQKARHSYVNSALRDSNSFEDPDEIGHKK
ncbi:hypothetical protein PoB_002930700, partial [Plakobranchus ocellatus]